MNQEEFPPQVSLLFNFSLFLYLFIFGESGSSKHLLGLQQYTQPAWLSKDPSLILTKSQTLLNFSNYTLTQLTGVISALTLYFTQAVVLLNLHWLFYRLLRNVATDTFWGIQDPRRKKQRKQNPTTNTGG
jgi:hypothetical protein